MTLRQDKLVHTCTRSCSGGRDSRRYTGDPERERAVAGGDTEKEVCVEQRVAGVIDHINPKSFHHRQLSWESCYNCTVENGITHCAHANQTLPQSTFRNPLTLLFSSYRVFKLNAWDSEAFKCGLEMLAHNCKLNTLEAKTGQSHRAHTSRPVSKGKTFICSILTDILINIVWMVETTLYCLTWKCIFFHSNKNKTK